MKAKKNYTNGSFLIPIAISILVIGGIYLTFLSAKKSCEATVNFSVNNIDSRFKISKEEVLKTAQESADSWNNQTGEKLLSYDAGAKLKINLIYDDRQANLDKLNSMSQSSIEQKGEIDSTDQKFQTLLNAYNADLKAYDDKVIYWNNKGGAPSNIFNQLKQDKAQLDKRRDALNQLAASLNLKINQYNEGVEQLNSEIDQRKNVIITQGLYKPTENEIDIYTFGNEKELRLVLMHELGHAMGLDHDQGSSSIMYYLLGDQNLDNPTLSEQDIAGLNNRCKVSNQGLLNYILRKLHPTGSPSS